MLFQIADAAIEDVVILNHDKSLVPNLLGARAWFHGGRGFLVFVFVDWDGCGFMRCLDPEHACLGLHLFLWPSSWRAADQCQTAAWGSWGPLC